MTEINRVLSGAARRLWVGAYLRALVVALMIATGGLVLGRLAQRLFIFDVDWKLAWIIAGGVAVVAAAVWTWLTRPAALAVARVVDEKAQTRESLSTALCVEKLDDPWSKAAVEQAKAAARRVVVRDVIEISVPRWWPMPFVLVGLFFLAGLLPQSDLVKMLTGKKPAAEQKAEIIEAKADVKTMDDRLDELLAKVGDETLKPEAAPEAEATKPPETAEDIRLEQMKKLTSLDDRLNELRNGEKAQSLDELKSRLENLKQPEGAQTELTKMVQSLQKGDVQQASMELSKLMNKLGSGQLSDEQKKLLEKQLKDLAKQLEQLSKDQSELERKLAEAGLDKKLANNPDALKKAMENAKNLTPEQKKQLEQQSQACKNASNKLGKMSSACQNASKEGASAGKMGELGEQLSEMEMAEQQANSLAAAQDEVKKQLSKTGQAMGQCEGGKLGGDPKESQAWKSGTRKGPGRANGGDSRAAEGEFNLNKEKVKSPNQGGPIIGTTVIEGGEQVRGESVAKFNEALKAGDKAATEAIENKQIPREYHDAVKNYFGRLGKKGAPAGAPAEAPKPAVPVAPAPDAAPAKTGSGDKK